MSETVWNEIFSESLAFILHWKDLT